MISRSKFVAGAVASVLVGMISYGAQAAILTVSPTAPTVDGADIAQLVGGDFFPDQDNYAVYYNRPNQGQSFTTLGNSSGYTLSSITVKSFYPDGPNAYQLRIGTVSGTSFTPIATETSNPLAQPPGAYNYYFTFTLSTPLTLAPNTVYGFDLSGTSFSGAGIAIFNHLDSSAGGDLYTGGAAYSSGASGVHNSPITTGALAGDRVFHLDLTANPVPEPTAVALVGAVGGAAMIRRRR